MIDEGGKSSWALVTGSTGGIGHNIVEELMNNGWNVVHTDKIINKDRSIKENFIKYDLEKLVKSQNNRDIFKNEVRQIINKDKISAIVHNAAKQNRKNFEDTTIYDWQEMISINLLSTVVINQIFLDDLKEKKGSIINITSIHSSLTKKQFSMYATTKAALSCLTKSLSIEFGEKIRVNAIEPAAIQTAMLEKGFEKHPKARNKLNQYHPTKRIGNVKDISRAVIYLLDEKNTFLNGTILKINGGINNCLHDPE